MPADPSSSSTDDATTPDPMAYSVESADESEPNLGASSAVPAPSPSTLPTTTEELRTPPLTRLERRQLLQSPPNALDEDELDSTDHRDPDGALSNPSAPLSTARLERKLGDGTKPFTRLVTRPETTVAANLAAERIPSERVIPISASPPPAFRKIRNQHEPECRPSRLQGVLAATWSHSRLGWLDNLGRLRTFLFTGLITTLTVVIVWPYLKEVFRKRETGVAAAAVEAQLPSDGVRQAAIRRDFDRYLATPELKEKLPFVLDQKRVKERMKDFYLGRLEKDPVIASYGVSLPIRAGAEWWFSLDCTRSDGSRSTVFMKETPTGGQLDWENFTSYGSMAWDKFNASRPAAPQSMRVQMRQTDRFTGKYTSDSYLAFEISHRSGPPTLFGYSAKNSRSGQSLADEPKLKEWKPVNLYLNWESDAGDPQAILIGDLIRNNWLDALTNGSTPEIGSPAPVLPLSH